MYPLEKTVEATEEPVSFSEINSEIHYSTNIEDVNIARKIKTARNFMESRTSRIFLTSTWKLYLDNWGSTYFPIPSWGIGSRRVITIPAAPIQSIESITYVDANDEVQTLPEESYHLNNKIEPSQIILLGSFPQLSSNIRPRITVEFVAGYQSIEKIPDYYRQGCFLMTLHMLENRSPFITEELKEIPAGLQSVINMFTVQGLIDRNERRIPYEIW